MTNQGAEWTVMIYMNADSNKLIDEAFDTLRTLAQFGGNPDVRIVVQLDVGKPDPRGPGWWEHARRFCVQEAMPAHRAYALPGFADHVDMGDERTLAQFIGWARTEFPATHNMLVIWGHGQGYGGASARFLRGEILDPYDATLADVEAELLRKPTRFHTALFDENPLYVRELQTALESFPAHTFDIVGFDSCLMAMLEVAHAVRRSARFMLASEEVVPGSGWSYGWLQDLLSEPSMNAEDLACRIVDRSVTVATGCPAIETFSALRLGSVDSAASSLDDLVRLLMEMGEPARSAVSRARRLCLSFGYGQTTTVRSIDLLYFLDCLIGELADGPARTAADYARRTIHGIVLRQRASPTKGEPPYGAQGIAIYFPDTRGFLERDPYKNCYLGGDPNQPQIEFAQLHRWKDFFLWFLGDS